ncbi:MAG: hypothetical protein K6T80_03530 [Firmicutes bacterium]|nr:hypothetical protein [Bacillota bacterium]
MFLGEDIFLKLWHVEDAGGGCRAFPEVLVLVCESTGEVYSDRIPLTWSDGTSMEEKACRIVLSLMQKAGVTREDRLLVCSGNIFHAFHKWLDENSYNWEQGKIDGFAHDVAEELFHRQATAAGFPENIRLIERNYREYYRVIENWVAASPDRHRYFKDREVRKKPAETRYVLKSNGGHTRTCLLCRQKIRPYTPLVVYRARENGKKIRRYYHPSCSPVEPLKKSLATLTVDWETQKVEGVILSAKEGQKLCAVCRQPIATGESTFFGYLGDQLITGHLSCFEKNKGMVRGA